MRYFKRGLLPAIALILFLTLTVNASAQSYFEINEVYTLNADGTTNVKAEYEISIGEGYSFPSGSEFYFFVPLTSKNIDAEDEGGEVDVDVKGRQNDRQIILPIRRDIVQGEPYLFEITYTIQNKPIVNEPNFIFEHGFLTGVDSYSMRLILPPKAELGSLRPGETEPNLEKAFSPKSMRMSQTDGRIIFDHSIKEDSLPEEREISISFHIPGLTATSAEVFAGYFKFIVPQRYSQTFEGVYGPAQRGMGLIEEELGLKNPFSTWDVAVTSKAEESFFQEAFAGFYSGDEANLTLNLNLVQANPEALLETLFHEAVHGIVGGNGLFSQGIDWWNEGIANAVAYRILDKVGISTALINKQNKYILDNFPAPNNFINGWSPHTDKEFIFEKYVYSTEFVRELMRINPDIVKDFNKLALENNVTLGATYKEQNNQMLFLLSKAAGRDLYDTFVRWGLEVSPLSEMTAVERKAEGIDATLKSLESAAPLNFFKGVREEYNSALKKFYSGDYSAASAELDIILSKAFDVDTAWRKTYPFVSAAGESVTALEQKYGSQYFGSAREKMQNAMSLMELAKFDEAKRGAEDAEKLAMQIEQEVLRVQQEIRAAEAAFEKSNVFWKSGFLGESEQLLKEAQMAFSTGDLKLASEKATESLEKVNASTKNALITYLVIAGIFAGIYFEVHRLFTKRKLKGKKSKKKKR